MRGVNDITILPNLDSWDIDIFADYSGSDRKDGLISPAGERYLIKFAEKHQRQNTMDTSYVNNVLSEYLSSHILSIIGYDVHETFIGTRNGELVVACKNFTSEDTKLIEFGTYLRKHYDSGDVGRIPDMSQIQFVLTNDPTLKPYAEKLLQSYADRFVGDAFVGNFDRHMGNFGYLISRNGSITPSPIYDNGSTLFPGLSEKGMREDVLPYPIEIAKRTLLFPKAALTVNKQKVCYYDMLTSNYDPHMSKAVRKMVPVIQKKLPEIQAFINAQDFLSDTRKTFYKTMLSARIDMILKPAFEQCHNRTYNQKAYERLQNGVNYTEEMFLRTYEALQKSQEWEKAITKLTI